MSRSPHVVMPSTVSPPSNHGDRVTTARLVLRPLQPSDSEEVFALRSDPRVLYWTVPDDHKKSYAWLKAVLENEKSMCYTVSLLPTYEGQISDSTPQIIGTVGSHNPPNVGYMYRPSTWGKGYATEALKAWLERYWQKYQDGNRSLEGEEKLYLKAYTGSENQGSKAVLRKCGFNLYEAEEVPDERPWMKQEERMVTLERYRLERPKTNNTR